MNRRILLKHISLLPFVAIESKARAMAVIPDNKTRPLTDESSYESIEELSKGVFFAKSKVAFFENGNYAEAECNNGWIIFNDFVVVIDANFPSKASLLLEEIRKTTDKPVKYVFNTHHHGDHLYGNGYWVQNGAIPIAYTGVVRELQQFETGYYGKTPGRWENIAKNRADLARYSLQPPIITFNEKLIIEDRTRRLELLHVGVGHTRGDGVAYLANEGILFAGDSCLNGPYNLFRDADIKSWITTLNKIYQLNLKILVPGHGPLGDANTVTNQRAYLKVLYHWVTKKKVEGVELGSLKQHLPELRAIILGNRKIRTYLPPEREVAAGFSLQAHAQKIFETIS